MTAISKTQLSAHKDRGMFNLAYVSREQSAWAKVPIQSRQGDETLSIPVGQRFSTCMSKLLWGQTTLSQGLPETTRKDTYIMSHDSSKISAMK